MHIRDPIHGAIELTPDERALVDSPQYQRLRNVKQLGFADLAFPGATHTRYAHGLGAMAVATRVFDALAPRLALEPGGAARRRPFPPDAAASGVVPRSRPRAALARDRADHAARRQARPAGVGAERAAPEQGAAGGPRGLHAQAAAR